MADQLHVRAMNAAILRLWTRGDGGAPTPPSTSTRPSMTDLPVAGHRVARHSIVIGGGSAQFTQGARVAPTPDLLLAQAQLAGLLLATAGDACATPPERSQALRALTSLLELMRSGVDRVRTALTTDVGTATEVEPTPAPVFTVDADGSIVLLPDARSLQLPLVDQPDEAWSTPTLAPGTANDRPPAPGSGVGELRAPAANEPTAGHDGEPSTVSSSAAALASWVATMPRASGAGVARAGARARAWMSTWGADYRLSRRGLLLLTLLAPAVAAFLLMVVVQVSAGN
ncbi:MAG: hypothetical protein JWN72_716 [Thermoleophilia bacterium]|nr:hypothetical protein [Thermoleophilia bacterium]